ncbi:AAA family ATPase [uncultured Amnibacterium sp.]|uniref:helix-turn-helix transcriptional regulator n=1 Tax=uncultured Amnibacterium sp. TaxID=1631851 RepID=UPI0035CB9AD3
MREAESNGLVGRGLELASLQRFVDGQTEPALLLAGARGSGRTRLLQQLHRVRAERTVLVRGRAAASNAPWAGTTAVLEAVGGAASEALPEEHPDAEVGSVERLRRILTLLGSVSRASIEPIVVLVDDADLQDEQSQDALVVLASRMRGVPVRFLAGIAWPPVDDRFARLPMMRLDPLTDEELRRIAVDRPDPRFDPTTADLVARLCGGVPGVLVSQLERLTPAQRAGRAPLTVPLPAAFPSETMNAQRRFGLDPEEWQLLQRVATAPAVSMNALPAFGGVAAERLESLIARGLLSRESGFVSVPLPELRSQLYWQTAASVRASAHVEGAAAEEAGDPDLRDWHRSHVELDHTTSSTLYAAAASMLRKGLTAGALEVAERALGFASFSTPVQQQLEFARELLLHGCADLTARHLPPDRASMTRRQLFQRTRLELEVRAFVDDDLAMEPVDALVGRFRVELPEECADLLSLAGLLLIMDGALLEGAWRIHAAGLLSPPERTGRTLHHWADRLRNALLDGSRQGADLHDRVPADADVETRVAAALALMWEERYPAAREHLAIVASGWRGARSPWASRAVVLAVENDLRAGEFGHAVELARQVGRMSGPRSFGERVMLAGIEMHQRRFGSAEALIRSCEGDLDRQRRRGSGQGLARLRGTLALLQGDASAAAERFREALESTADVNPAVLWCHPDLAEALWRSGDLAAAAAVTNRMADGVARSPSRWGELTLRRCRAMLAADVEAAFTAAFLVFDGAELPFERARTHTVAALAAARAGLPEMAREEQRASMEAFRRLGATAWVDLVHRSAGASTAERSVLPMLTDTESAVLRLARRGAQNREIAAALFMSLRSVELRLTQIYRKFDARSRTHLFSLLPEDWPDDPDDRAADR